MRNPRAVKREERDSHAARMTALRVERRDICAVSECTTCVVSKCLRCIVPDGWRKHYQRVKLEWSMCLAPESGQDSHDELMRDYQKLFAGLFVEYSSLNWRSGSLLEWVSHTNESVIVYNRMYVETREWCYKMIVNGHMCVLGCINGVRSLEHLEVKVTQIPGVILTRIEPTVFSLRPCLTIFVELDILPQDHEEMVALIKNHVDAENSGFSLVERHRVDRYDFVEVGESPVAFSLRFNVARYDSLDLSKSTAFQRFRRRRKYKERKPPDTSTIRGRLRLVFQNRAVFKRWTKTGETPNVHS